MRRAVAFPPSATLGALLLGGRDGGGSALLLHSSVVFHSRTCHRRHLQPKGRHDRAAPYPPPPHRRPFSSSPLALGVTMPSATGSLVTVPQAIEAHRSRDDGRSGKNVFIDGSWHMPGGATPRNGRAEYAAGPRVPAAFYFDIDDVAPLPGSASNPKKLPHMKPPAKMFASAMDRMGISPNDTLYVYATEGCGFYHRAYWTLSSCGFHDPAKVKLVQGSLKEWEESGGDLEHGRLKEGDPRLFRMAHINWETEAPKYVCWKDIAGDSTVNMKEVRAVVQGDADALIVDARSTGRFYGTEPEPRPGLRGGHMPGAISVPFLTLLDPTDPTKFLPMQEVKDTFVRAGIASSEVAGGASGSASAKRRIICSCGSGVTAAALAVGLEECGLRTLEEIFIYDGSWIDWGGDENTPIVT